MPLTRTCAICSTCIAAAAMSLALGDSSALAQSGSATRGVVASESDAKTLSPEATLRTFLISMITGNKQRLSEVAMPNKELGLIVGVQNLPPGAVKAIKARMESMPISQLSVGDVITLPGGKKLTMTQRHINKDRVMLSTPDAPIPFDVLRVEKVWRVNPKPIIAARKAAKAAP